MLKSIYTIDVRVSKTVFISVKVLHFTHRKEKKYIYKHKFVN